MLKEFDVGFVAVIYVQTGGVGRHIFFWQHWIGVSLYFSFSNFIGKFVLYTF